MKIYNTLTKEVEEFIPRDKKEVKMYTCGPTVYNYAHIGNLRTYIFEDVLEKTLTYLGYKVKRVMNITDVGHMTSDADEGEDKMILTAKKEKKTIEEIAAYYTEAFFRDLEKLNIKKPEIIVKASDEIPFYIEIIEELLKKGYAYEAGGNVYFDVSKIPDYYVLSGKNKEDLLIGAREDVTMDPNKRNPHDFGLWFTHSKYEKHLLEWDSPWGKGYPGWHIECSGIGIKYLGDKIDIHCGGVDNIFPHHSNEIAQSNAYLDYKWCNYWVHGEHLNDKTGKMSKSKGEFLTLSLLEEKGYDPLIYRFFCLNSHYRKQLVFTYESLDQASNAYKKLKNRIKNIEGDDSPLLEEKIKFYQNKFKEEISDDLSTANALTLVFEVLKDEELNNNTKRYLINDFDQVLSLDLLTGEEDLSPEFIEEIEALISERNEAKKNKNYEKADKIRDELLKKGIQIKDYRDYTAWEVIKKV